MRRIGYVVGILAVAGVLAMSGCDMETGSTIQGNVLDVKGPARAAGVAGVSVSLEGTDFVTTTDADGKFEIVGVPEGEYVLVISLGDAKGAYPIKVDGGVVVQLENLRVADDGTVTVDSVTVTEIDDDSDDDISLDDDESLDDGESSDDDESLEGDGVDDGSEEGDDGESEEDDGESEDD
ncbi:MAG: carboxypeptidase-like regulatory domain-containing protein [Lentisphaerae bacterium]|nr:carboxypeptidase-like regulatory domain-containing protein [Lentisphaerota bacterium]